MTHDVAAAWKLVLLSVRVLFIDNTFGLFENTFLYLRKFKEEEKQQLYIAWKKVYTKIKGATIISKFV